MADKQIKQLVYTSAKRCVYALYEFLTTECGWFLAAPNAKQGTWTSPGDALVTTDYVVLETATTAPFRLQVAILYREYAVGTKAIVLTQAPLVGLAGGWNQGGGTFDGPFSGEEVFYLNGGGSTKFSIIGSDRRFVLWAEWTPATIDQLDIEFKNTNPDTIIRIAGDFGADGWAPYTRFVVSGTGFNNGSYTVGIVSSLGKGLTLIASDVLVAEGPGAAILTPSAVHKLAYVGRIIPAESSTFDPRPAVIRACNFEMGPYGLSAGIKRLHAKTVPGYVNLVNGYVESRARQTDAPGEIAAGPLGSGKQPSSVSGKYKRPSAEVDFNEVVAMVTYIENAGRLDGVGLFDPSVQKKWIGAGYMLAHNGVVIPWPCGTEPT